jgi:hypothetical protein
MEKDARSKGAERLGGAGEKDDASGMGNIADGLQENAEDDTTAIPSRLSTEGPSSDVREEEDSVTTVMSPQRVDMASRGPWKDPNEHMAGGETEKEMIHGAIYDEDGFLLEDEDLGDSAEDVVDRQGHAANDALHANGEDAARCGEFENADESIEKTTGSTMKNLDGDFRRASLEHDTSLISGREESTLPDLSPFQASKKKPIHQRRFSRDVNSSFGSGRHGKGENEPKNSPSVASCGSAMRDLVSQDGDDIAEMNIFAQKKELEALAALEVAVWCAGYSGHKLGSQPGRITNPQTYHLTPARRLARTVIALGEKEGSKFVNRAIEAIKVACASSLGDVKRIVLWWSALITLRVRFFTLIEEESSFFSWLEPITSLLVDAESALYMRMVDDVWKSCDVPGLLLGNGRSKGMDDNAGRIVSALDDSLSAINYTSRSNGANITAVVKTLRKLIVEDIAVKLDVALLKEQIQGWPNYRTTSSTGLELKLFVGKLSSWFESQGVKGPILPRMDSVANILVSQKSCLLDAEVRKAIAPRISITSICAILGQYQISEDEGSTDELEEIMKTLRANSSTRVDLNETYESLDLVEYVSPEAGWMNQQGIVQALCLDMSEESDEELEDLLGSERAPLLRDLWLVGGVKN